MSKTSSYLPTLYCPLYVHSSILPKRSLLCTVRVTILIPAPSGGNRGTGQITAGRPILILQLSSSPLPNLINALGAVPSLNRLVAGPVTITKPPLCTAPKDGDSLMVSAIRKERMCDQAANHLFHSSCTYIMFNQYQSIYSFSPMHAGGH